VKLIATQEIFLVFKNFDNFVKWKTTGYILNNEETHICLINFANYTTLQLIVYI